MVFNNLVSFSSSSLVLKILKDAHDAGKKFRVVVVDSRPKFEGRVTVSVATISLFFRSNCRLSGPPHLHVSEAFED